MFHQCMLHGLLDVVAEVAYKILVARLLLKPAATLSSVRFYAIKPKSEPTIIMTGRGPKTMPLRALVNLKLFAGQLLSRGGAGVIFAGVFASKAA